MGVCAYTCDEYKQAVDDSGTFSSNIPYKPETIQDLPKPKGTEAQYAAMADQLVGQAHGISNEITGNTEVVGASSALASDNSAEAERKALELEKTNVDEQMQEAAKDAAIFSSANTHRIKMVHELTAARKQVADQEQVVAQAKKAVADEETKLAQIKSKADEAERREQSAKMSATNAGDHYTTDKTAAIKADKAYEENVLKEKRQAELKKVLETDVKNTLNKFAQDDARKAAEANAKQAAAGGATKAKDAKVPPAMEAKKAVEETKAPVCKNCDALDADEQKQNPNATCKDCDGWAAEGQCTDAKYKEFMHKNCPKSCGVGACKAADIPAAAKPTAVHPTVTAAATAANTNTAAATAANTKTVHPL